MNLAVKCRLESIGEEIEYDLFPHFAINVDRLGNGRAFDDQLQPGAFNRGTEYAGELRGEEGKIRWLVGGLHAAHFDANEIEQAVYQLEQAQGIPVQHLQRVWRGRDSGSAVHLQPGPSISVSGVRSSWLTLLKNAVFARSRSVKLFGAALLRFIGFCVGDAGGNLSGSQVKEAGIACVELTIGVEGRDENAGRLLLAAAEERD